MKTFTIIITILLSGEEPGGVVLGEVKLPGEIACVNYVQNLEFALNSKVSDGTVFTVRCAYKGETF